jgi:pseudo-rSAM protein
MRKSNLLESKIAQKTIFARSKINPRAFGTLYILNNGSILANPSLPPIGNIHTIDIYEAILSEMHGGKTWIGPRNRVIPCKNCVFNCLCPPLSNYESVFARNNLCHIYRSPSG